MPPPEPEDDYNFVHFDGLPETVGNHVLYAWRDSQPTAEWRRFDFSEFSRKYGFDENPDACIGLFIQITDVSSDQEGEISIYGDPEAEGCPTRTSEDAN
jgi:hypothetical protein